MGVSPESIAAQLLKLLGPALKEAKAAAAAATPPVDLSRFTGLYASAWGETIVVPWDGGLAALDVPTDDVLEDLTKLRLVADNVFRRVRDDGDDLGEEVVFEHDSAGTVTRLLWHQNYSRKVR